MIWKRIHLNAQVHTIEDLTDIRRKDNVFVDNNMIQDCESEKSFAFVSKLLRKQRILGNSMQPQLNAETKSMSRP
jgi:hypothetical protein